MSIDPQRTTGNSPPYEFVNFRDAEIVLEDVQLVQNTLKYPFASLKASSLRDTNNIGAASSSNSFTFYSSPDSRHMVS